MNQIHPDNHNSRAEILIFNKGGRDARQQALGAGVEAPREFFYGYLEALEAGHRIEMLSAAASSSGLINRIGDIVEQICSRSSQLGWRFSFVRSLRSRLDRARTVLSFTDGFSLTLGLHYHGKTSRPYVIGGFHCLSDIERRARSLFRPLVAWLIKRALRGLDHIFFFGPADRAYAIERYGLEIGRTSIYRFGVDTDFWRPSTERYEKSDVIALGQDPNRDYDTLVAAPTNVPVRIITHQHIHIPPDRTNVSVTAGSYFRPGAVSDADLRLLYQRALAVVVPLKDVYQPTGYSVTLQAMACGAPVILSRIRGLWAPELLRHEENCLLVPPGDSRAIAEAIARIAGDRDFAERLGQAARRFVLEHFNLDTVRQSTFALIERSAARS